MRGMEWKTLIRDISGSMPYRLNRLGRGRGFRKMLLEGIFHPYFPVSFLLRNIETLSKEPSFGDSPLRTRRELLRRVVLERTLIFLNVKRWILGRGAWESFEAGISNLKEDSSGSYCNHCGRCCEIASGFPEFPPQSREVPQEWLRIFGDGLGRGHRFCAFLWEANGLGRSFCSIHPWRSNPCRIFEADECEFLKKDPAFPGPSTRTELKGAYRSMLYLINGR